MERKDGFALLDLLIAAVVLMVGAIAVMNMVNRRESSIDTKDNKPVQQAEQLDQQSKDRADQPQE